MGEGEKREKKYRKKDLFQSIIIYRRDGVKKGVKTLQEPPFS